MRFGIGFACVLSILAILVGCGKNSVPEDTIPPPKPVVGLLSSFLTSQNDSLSGPFDQGASMANAFRLVWLRQDEPDLAEYRVFFRPAHSAIAPYLAGVLPAIVPATSFVVRDVRIQPSTDTDSSQLFEYWVHSIDASGNVSPASDTVRFELIRKADGLSVTDTTNGVPTFHAGITVSDLERAPDRYSIKIRAANQDLVWVYSRLEYRTQVDVRFNEGGGADPHYLTTTGGLLPGEYEFRIEFWRQDHAGSIATRSFRIL